MFTEMDEAGIATDFPSLTISIQHGGWPYVRETLGVLYKQPNVVTVPGQHDNSKRSEKMPRWVGHGVL
ncbi:MAG: amidohydrolase family protein [Acidimicrobiales bacterium]|nr:amidohydrolase family protein [Acidimicrobiales bacterium]MXX43142.1 amidohydrolase family protein [Acidimicrobiales bacterium]MXZ15120.1 amidohydrolase family protein [Acidimicrobiales bacterium]MYA25597.1 amidohydrolase family protein [Acidimicrobiales bacterium]MYB82473.1 amidohydrolase family protein [Acidimicrobiales bacterium]